MKKVWLAMLLSAVVILVGCAALEGVDTPDATKPPMTVDVMLQENEGITILGENPVAVPVGGDASFAVQLRDGYKIAQLGQGAVYEDGVVTLTGVKFPTTVQIATRKRNDLTVSVNNDEKQGQITSNVTMGTVLEDTEVKLQVTPEDNLVFLGYSVGESYFNGGTIVCTSAEYTFTVTENTVVYTNYYKVGSGRLVVYEGNGAKEGTQYYVFSDKSPYIGPNALANKGQFTREGYVLCGYNTKADGSGTYYGPGWSVILPEDSKAPFTLYAQWMQVTEKEAFTYTVADKKVTITGYQGDHETVVVPETIDAMPVVKIAPNAFAGGKFKTLYLSRNLMTIEDDAFAGCKGLTTLYLCDTPSSMKDEAFSDCDALQKLYMLACIDPRYSKINEGMYKVKYQRLLTAKGKKVVFQGGSNVAYGLDITTIHEVLGEGYAGINFGARRSSPSNFFVEVAAAHMGPGDILVLCPEYHKYQYGHNEMNSIAWQIFEGAYNAYADVDIRNYTKVFTSFAAFNTNRYKTSPKSYDDYDTSGGKPAVSKFGEFNLNHNKQSDSLLEAISLWERGKSRDNELDLSLLSASYNKNMSRAFDKVIASGAKVYFSFPAFMKIAVTEAHRAPEHIQAFKTGVMERFPQVRVISDPGTYLMDSDLFYNSNYHLTTSGSKVRSELLAQDILAQLAKEE